MKEKILNAFEFLDYKILLNEDFVSRSSINPSYSLRAYSRDLKASVGFLSDVMRGKNNLSLQSGKRIFKKLGYQGLELEYIENLIKRKISRQKDEVQAADIFVNRYYLDIRYPKSKTNLKIFESKNHLIVYGLLEKISKVEDLFYFGSKLKISKNQIILILKDFTEAGYIRFDKGQYKMTGEMTGDYSNVNLHFITKELAGHLIDLIYDGGGLHVPDRIFHTLILGLDEASYALATEAYKHFIKKLGRIGKNSTGHDRVVVTSDIFYSVN